MKHSLILFGGIGALVLAAAASFWAWLHHKQEKQTHSKTSKLSGNLAEEKLKSDIIINAIEDGVIVIDNQKVIRVFNPSASRITGWPINEAIGLSYQSVIKLIDDRNQPYSDQQDPINRTFQEVKPVRDNKATLISRSEKHLALNLSVAPLINESGQLDGAVAVFRDVSEERGEQQQRAEFISTASHEMRTPVAAIEGYLALALNPNVSQVSSKGREFLEKAHEATQHLGKLFQDLLTSSKAEDGRLTDHPVNLEVGGFLEKLVEELKLIAQKKGLAVEYVVGTGADSKDQDEKNVAGGKVIRPLYYVQADPERIREVISNLFDNAVKYTTQGTISLGLTGNDEVVQVFVKDTGSGIPREDLSHLFQKFYRIDNSATRTVGGTGLGLFICRKIVELYKGSIWAESEIGKGSTFYINLPRISTQQAGQQQAANTVSEQVASTKS